MKNIMAYEREVADFADLQTQLLADIKSSKIANELMIAIHNGIFEDKKQLNELWARAREMAPEAAAEHAPAAEEGEAEMEEMAEVGEEGEAEMVEDEEIVDGEEGGIEEEDLEEIVDEDMAQFLTHTHEILEICESMSTFTGEVCDGTYG